MSDYGDKLVEFEESKWQELAEAFIELNYSKPTISWEEFVMDKFEQHCADIEWEPDE
jgi:hypothetical protein